MFGDDGIETSTLWNYKIIGRYVLPYDIGFSGSWKVQSGFNYAPHHQRDDAGRRRAHDPRRADRLRTAIRRSAILDLRLDKSIDLGKFGKFTPMLDVFNIMNSGVPTTCARPTPRRRRSRK